MKLLRKMTLMISILLFGLSCWTSATAGPKTVRMKVAFAVPTRIPIMKPLVDAFSEIKLMSDGSIQSKLYEPGQIVPPFQIQEAVSKNQIQAGWSGSLYLAGQIPAASLFTSCPFGFNNTEHIAWLYYGNGMKLYQEMYDKYGFNVKVFPMSIIPIESGGWFRKPINSVKDLKGLRLRWPGLAGKVLSRLGASVSTIPLGEVYQSLDRGAIDGAELSGPYFDIMFGFHKVAKYNYFPGWHQTSTNMELTINKDIWNSMSKGQQLVIENAVFKANVISIAQFESNNGKVMKQNAETRGVKNMIYPPDVLNALQREWLKVAAEESAKDPFFKKVWTDINTFMEEYEYWERHSYRIMPPQKFK